MLGTAPCRPDGFGRGHGCESRSARGKEKTRKGRKALRALPGTSRRSEPSGSARSFSADLAAPGAPMRASRTRRGARGFRAQKPSSERWRQEADGQAECDCSGRGEVGRRYCRQAPSASVGEGKARFHRRCHARGRMGFARPRSDDAATGVLARSAGPTRGKRCGDRPSRNRNGESLRFPSRAAGKPTGCRGARTSGEGRRQGYDKGSL